MRTLVSILFMLLGSGTAFAVNVRSGEHADFSRLVVEVEQSAEWEFGRIQDGYALRSSLLTKTPDLSRVFQYIPRTRIKDVRFKEFPPQLEIVVECECHGDAFEIRNGRIVVDIKSGPPPRDSTFERALSVGSGVELFLDEEIDSAGYKINSAVSERKVKEDNGSYTVQQLELEKELSEGLALAMTQGLIESRVVGHIARDMADSHGEQSEISMESGRTPYEDAALPGATVKTQIDLDRPATVADHSSMNRGGCETLWEFDPSLYQGDPEEVVYLERQNLYDENGTLDQDVSLKLASAFIGLGFGREASAVLDLLPDKNDEFKQLKTIALVVDDETYNQRNIFWGQIECRGAFEIWEVLSRSTPPLLDDRQLARLRLNFMEMPEPLQKKIVPRLVKRLSEAGHLETASVLKNTVSRADWRERLGSDSSFRFHLPHYEDVNQREILLEKQVFEDNPDAILELISYYQELQEPVPDEVLKTISSMAVIYRGLQVGNDLAQAELEILIEKGKLEDASVVLRSLQSRGAMPKDQRMAEFITRALRVSSRLSVLEFMIAHIEIIEDLELSEDVLNEIVVLFMSSGLSFQAELLRHRT